MCWTSDGRGTGDTWEAAGRDAQAVFGPLVGVIVSSVVFNNKRDLNPRTVCWVCVRELTVTWKRLRWYPTLGANGYWRPGWDTNVAFSELP